MYNNPTLGPLIAGIHYLSTYGLVLKVFPFATSAVKKNKLFRGALKLLRIHPKLNKKL